MAERTPLEEAIAQYRLAHPEDGDIPDAKLAKLFVVVQAALAISARRLARAVRNELFRNRFR